MSVQGKFIRIAWLTIAIALEWAATLGGDASIVWGWVLLIWTAPVSILFQFFIYDVALRVMTREGAQFMGAILEVVCSYVFLFNLIPKIWLWMKKSRN